MSERMARPASRKSFLQRLRTIFRVGVTAVLFILVAVACGSPLPPTDAEVPVFYPGARLAITSEVQSTWRVPGIDIYRTIAFHTDDTPDAVLAFYRKSLLPEGWAISGCQEDVTGTLTFVWEQPWSTGMYIVEVVTDLQGAQNVELQLAKHTYKNITAGRPSELLSGPMYDCLGVQNDRTDNLLLTVITTFSLILLASLHIVLSARVWQARSRTGMRLTILILVAQAVITTLLLIIVGIVLSIFGGTLIMPFSYSRLRADSENIANLVFEFPFQYPLLYFPLLILGGYIGILLYKPLSRIEFRRKLPQGSEDSIPDIS